MKFLDLGERRYHRKCVHFPPIVKLRSLPGGRAAVQGLALQQTQAYPRHCARWAFDELPDVIRHLGPWIATYGDELKRLQMHYRTVLAEQKFVLPCKHVKDFRPEG